MSTVTARTRVCAVAGLSMALACACVDGHGRGAVMPASGRVQAVEARPDAEPPPAATDVRMQPGRYFALVGGNDFARSVVAANPAPLPEGWAGEVRVADGCMQVACLHWIAESADGLRRVEMLPVVFDSVVRNTTPDIVYHEAKRVRWMLDATRRQLFPDAGETGRHEEDPPHPHGYGHGTTGARWIHDHVRDGVPLRSVVEVRATSWDRPRDAGDAEIEARGMGVTSIDLQMQAIASTAPADDPDPRAQAWVANFFRLGGRDARGASACDPSQGSFDGSCRMVLRPQASPAADGFTDQPPVDRRGDW